MTARRLVTYAGKKCQLAQSKEVVGPPSQNVLQFVSRIAFSGLPLYSYKSTSH
jgi:hypothetical protein